MAGISHQLFACGEVPDLDSRIVTTSSQIFSIGRPRDSLDGVVIRARRLVKNWEVRWLRREDIPDIDHSILKANREQIGFLGRPGYSVYCSISFYLIVVVEQKMPLVVPDANPFIVASRSDITIGRPGDR